MICKTMNTTKTTPAQKTGRLTRGRSPSEGSFVAPLTSPSNSLTGLGLVRKLMTTVTNTQIIQDQRARYISSAIALASLDPAITAKASGSILTQAHIAMEATVPASNPQKPPSAVVLFHRSEEHTSEL